MLALCASHVSSVPRLKALTEMVASWRGQLGEVPLRLSVSCEPSLARLTERVVERLMAEHGAHGLLVEFVGTERRSQFEHYRELARSSPRREGTWVMFSDDDDIWHPQRSMHVKLGAERAASDGGMLSLRVGGAVAGELARGTAEEVERAMESGAMAALEGTGKDDEYWMYACRLTTLLDFVQRAGEKLIKSEYCDMYLVKYLRFSVGYRSLQVPLSTTARWSYAYREMPRLRRATTRDDPRTLEEQVALLYATMPLGRQDALNMEKKARGMGMTQKMESEGMSAGQRATLLRAWSRLVDNGAMDEFAFSPMPLGVAAVVV